MFILPLLFTMLAQQTLRVPPDVQEKKLVEKVEPVYPKFAKARKITGTVIFAVHIGKDGSIVDSKLISGHPLLVPAAEEALRKFVYVPTIVRGEAVEVVTQARFYFTEPNPGASTIQVASTLSGRNLVKKVAPIYPPLAKKAGIQGIVHFRVKIAKDGTVHDIELISGHADLVAAARKALEQWVYLPAMLNGEPVEIISQVDIQFTLDQ
jgi:TonB family protein